MNRASAVRKEEEGLTVHNCFSEGTEFKEFVARSQHAMAYDAAKDLVYIMGGTSLKDSMFWDMLSYHFGNYLGLRLKRLKSTARECQGLLLI